MFYIGTITYKCIPFFNTVTFFNKLRLIITLIKTMEAEEEIHYIQRILNGETELYAIFLDCYSHSIYLLIVQMVSCPEDAEELVQDTFLKAFNNLKSYKKESRFSTWLYRIAYNVAISFMRKKRHEFLYIDENTINNVPDEKEEDILCPTDNEERIAALIKAIELLNVEEKAVIMLFYYEQKTIEEVGNILDINISNVKVKLHRIRKKLYLLMSEKGGVSSLKEKQ